MADPTPRWGWPRPVEADSVDPVRDIRALALALDVVGTDDQGLLADRPVSTGPAPGKKGRYYFSTDTGILSRDTGTSWVDIGFVADGSITTPKLANLSVTTAKLADLNVTNGKLADGAVDSRVIADGSVGFIDLAAGLKPSQGASGASESLRALGSAAGNAAAGLNPTIGGRLTLSDQGSTNGIQIGGDSNLYRSAVNTLKTDGTLFAAAGYRIGTPITGVAYQSQQVAAQTVLQNLLIGTDANAAFSILGDGKHQWGLGGASALDTNLYRGSSGVVKTDGAFNAVAGFQVSGAALASTHLADSSSLARLTGATFTGAVVANGGYSIGTPLTGTSAYRSQQVAAQTVLSNKLLAADANDAFHLLGSGKMEWGAGGASVVDTNLYRWGASILKSDQTLLLGQEIYARHGVSTQVIIGDTGAGNAGFRFGSATDTNLYRANVGALKTDAGLTVSGSGSPTSGQGLEMGTVTNVAYFQALDRSAGTVIALHLQGSEISLYDTGQNQRLKIDGTGIGFLGATPVARPGSTNGIKASLVSLGLITGGGATPLNLDGGALTSGALTATTITASGLVTAADLTATAFIANSMVRAQGSSQGSGTAGGAVELSYSAGTGDVQVRDTGTGFFQTMRVSGSSVTLRSNTTDRIKVDTTGIGFFGTPPTGKLSVTIPGGSTYATTYANTTPTLAEVANFTRGLALVLQTYGLLTIN